MEDVREELAESVQRLGVAVIRRELVLPAFPCVEWEEDRSGFLAAVELLRPSVVYAAVLQLSEADLGWLTKEYRVETDPDPDLDPARQLLREARTHIGEPSSVDAAFLHDGAAHTYEVRAPWWAELSRRMDDFVTSWNRAGRHEALALPDRAEKAWLPRLRELFLVNNDEYITMKPMRARDDYERRVLEREFTREEIRLIEASGCMARILDEWHGIRQQRVSKAEACFSKWAVELSRSAAFKEAKSQAARRSLAKEFLHEKEPLIVSGERVERMASLALNKLQSS